MTVFERCDFLLGANHTIIIVIPANLPKAETYTVSVSSRDIRFKAGYEKIAELTYQGAEIFERIINNTLIGLVEFPEGGSEFPGCITNVAYVEVRRAV